MTAVSTSHATRSDTPYRRLFDTMLEGVAWHEIICDDEGRPVDSRYLDINPAFERLTGRRREEVIGQTLRTVFPEIEDEWVQIFGAVALGGGQRHFEKHTRLFDRWYATTVYSPQKGQFVVVFEDVTERHAAEEILRRRDAILNAIAFAAREFLSATSWDVPINAVLARLGKAAEVSRMHVIANETNAAGAACFNRRFVWHNAGVRPLSKNALMQMVPWDTSAWRRWHDLLAAGEVIAGPSAKLPAPERRLLEGEGIKSILVVPVFAGRTWWGCLSLDECTRPREWSPLEIEAFKTSAAILGAALARGRNELTIAEQEQRYQTLFDLSPSGILLEDRHGMIVDANASLCESFGYTRDELVGQHVSCLVTENEKPLVAQHINRILDGAVLHHAVQNVRKDGSLCEMMLHEICVTLPNGEPSVLAVANDVTEQRRQERQLAQAERFLSSIFESIQDGLSILDRDLRILRTNPAMERWYGNSRPLVGKYCYEAYHCRTRPCPRCPSKFTLATGEPSHAVVPMVAPDGKRTGWVDLYTFPLHDSTTGELTGVIEYVRDITDRKRAEEELRESEANQRAILGALPDLVFRLKRDTTCVDFTAPSTEHLLVPPDEFINRRLIDVLPSDIGQLTQQYVEQTLATGEACVYQYHLQDNGTLRSYETRMVVSGNDEVLAIVRDITERRTLEEERIKSERLESLGVLAGGIAHDFNNILTTILGHISLAKMPGANDEIEFSTLLEEVERAAVRARDLTRQLLTFSKGGAPIKRAASLADIVIDSATFALRGSNSRCEFGLPGDLWPADVDPGQISQVVQNLVINADHAMASGGVVTLSAENLLLTERHSVPLPAGRYVKLTCSDTGTGIPREFLQKIFDPYFTTKQKGSGLGLTTTFSIIKKHGGHITVDSTIGKGTTFALFLPAAAATVREAGSLTPALVAARNEGRGRILFMDDEDTIRSLVSLVLGRVGYDVVLVEEGTQAVSAYRAARDAGQPFDLVILDLTIRGGMGGLETIEKLREVDPDVRAIVASGYSNDPVMAEHRAHGFLGVVSKPFKGDELRSVVHAVLEGDGTG